MMGIASRPTCNKPDQLGRLGAAAAGAKPLAMNGYKVKLVEVAVKRALLTAAGAAEWLARTLVHRLE